MAWKTCLTELTWFLKGDTNIKYLIENGCNIWTDDAYKYYKRQTPNGLSKDEWKENVLAGEIWKGETFIKPKIAETYTIDKEGGSWKVLEDFPVCIKKLDDKTIELIWQKSVSGQFTLQWFDGNITEEKVIVVESLF
jgi:thymidylate synthase